MPTQAGGPDLRQEWHGRAKLIGTEKEYFLKETD